MTEVLHDVPDGGKGTFEPLEPPVRAARAMTLGTRVIRGSVWILIQSVIVQGLAFITRVVVFRRLKEEEIAVALWAMGACMFISWIQPAIAEVIMQRQQHFKRWANSAFWLLVASTPVYFAAGAVLAWILSLFYKNALVIPIVLLTCVAAALTSLGSIWSAELSIAFNFRRLTMIGLAGSVCTALFTLAMTWGGMGAWSMVVPVLIASALMLVLLVKSARFRPSWNISRWRLISLWTPAVLMSVGAFFSNLVMQADNFFLGIYHKESLAAYGLAYSLSCQLMQLVSRSLRGVMLPALSAAGGDAQRVTTAYLESIRTACLICMPMSILLIPAAPFILLTIFSGRWAASVELFQVFLAGIAFTIVFAIAFSTMQSRGHVKLYVISNVFLGISFSGMAWLSASRGDARTLASCVTLFYVVTSLGCCLIAVGPAPWSTRGHFIVAVGTPFLNAMASAAAAFALMRATGWHDTSWNYGVVALLAGCVIYTLLAFAVQGQTVRTAAHRLIHALPPSLALGGVSMVSWLRRMVGVFPTPVVYHLHVLAHRVLGKKQNNAAHLAYIRDWPDPPRVVAGPFKGMIFTRETYSSALVPSLLGCYEAEIHEAIDRICTLQSDLIADIGAGEGYYAVGLALRNPQAQCVAFEMFKPVNHILGRVARQNGVAGRMTRPGICTPSKLETALARGRKPVLICDCEGAEDFLLVPDQAPALKRTVILVETHDHMNPGVSARIEQRFVASHTLRSYTTHPRTRSELPADYTLSDAEFEELIVEHRNAVQTFFLLEPRSL